MRLRRIKCLPARQARLPLPRPPRKRERCGQGGTSGQGLARQMGLKLVKENHPDFGPFLILAGASKSLALGTSNRWRS